MSPVWNQPSVVEHLVGGLLVVPVALEDLRALGEDLAVLGDADRRCPPTGRPTVPGFQCVGAVDRQRRAGLGEAVALEDLHADAVEEVGEPVAEGARRR